MAKNYQLNYIISAIDKASQTFQKVEDSLKRLDKSFEKSHARELKRNTARDALLSKSLKDRVSGEEKSLQQIENIRKKELNNWAREENRRFRQEKMRTRNSVRMHAQAVREKARMERKYTKSVKEAKGMATTSMAYITAPTAATSVLSLRNTMSMEQMKIRLLTMFGEEGEAVFKSAANYAKDTAFSIQDAVGLITDLKIGARNVGIETTQSLVQASQQIGNVLLAFSSSRENRQEAVNQLGQIAMAGRGSFRQDILVLNRRGIPIIQAIEDYTGKKYKELQETYGADLPARLIYDALMKFSTSPKIDQAMKLRSESLTQGWDTLTEGAFFFSAKYGDLLAKSFGLPNTFKKAGDYLFDMAEEMETTGKISMDIGKSSAAFATAWGLTVPAMVSGSFIAGKILNMIGGSSGMTAGAAILGRRFLYASSVMGGLYSLTVDWKDVWKDISDYGLPGALKHMDAIAASALGLYGTVKLIKKAIGAGLLAKIVAGAGATYAAASAGVMSSPFIAAGLASGAAYYGGRALGEFGGEKIGNYYDKLLTDQWRDMHKNEYINKEGDIKVENNIVFKAKEYDPKNYEIETKVTKNILDNPVTYTIGD
jgi:hypothetical protein